MHSNECTENEQEYLQDYCDQQYYESYPEEEANYAGQENNIEEIQNLDPNCGDNPIGNFTNPAETKNQP